MSELRRDPISGRWVIIAPDRGSRPQDYESSSVNVNSKKDSCPFCEGNESETPPEVYAERAEGLPADGPGWTVRVVSNKYPALQIEGDLDPSSSGIYHSMRGIGAHEVLIESPRHDDELATLSDDARTGVFRAARERILDLTGDRRFRYIQVFKNRGFEAGATLDHGHSQLIATPTVPRRLDEALAGFAIHERANGACVLCQIVKQERDEGSRILFESSEFVVFQPFAARFPFETWVVPTRHAAAFEDASDELLADFSRVLGRALRAFRNVLEDPPYNFVLHTAPINEPGPRPLFHWKLEVMPKLSRVAGFEWGTGFYINAVSPEDAAARLRPAL